METKMGYIEYYKLRIQLYIEYKILRIKSFIKKIKHKKNREAVAVFNIPDFISFVDNYKNLWKNKTADKILKDIQQAREHIMKL